MEIPLCSSSAQNSIIPFSAQRCVNLIPEPGEPGSKSKFVLKGTPGLTLLVDLVTGPIRGFNYMPPYLYIVAGSSVYRVNSSGVAVVVEGDAISGTAPVFMSNNGTQVVIVANPNGYILQLVEGVLNVAEIADEDFPGASSVDFIDGYFVFSQPSTGRMFISSLLEGEDYDALDFITAEASPDDLVCVIVDHLELFLVGEKTIEVWGDSGEASFPFARKPGIFVEHGTVAPHSVVRMDNSLFWLAEDRMVYRMSGYQPARVSTFSIEQEIAGFEVVEDAHAWSYAQAGHTFYVLTFPTERRTFVYDAANQLWQERQSGLEEYDRWRVATGIMVFGGVLVGDEDSGQVFRLDPGVYTEDGEIIRRIATLPIIYPGTKRAVMHSLELVCDTGHGLTTGQGSDPLVMLRWSDDGGYTWSTEYTRSLGAQGAYRQRVKWRRLGRFQSRIPQFVITDPIKVALIACDAELEQLAS